MVEGRKEGRLIRFFNLPQAPPPPHYQDPHKGITPFLPSNKVPGSFRPMVSSQKVSHVPPEVFQPYEAQEIGSSQGERYQVVSTTEK